MTIFKLKTRNTICLPAVGIITLNGETKKNEISKPLVNYQKWKNYCITY